MITAYTYLSCLVMMFKFMLSLCGRNPKETHPYLFNMATTWTFPK